MLDTILAQTRAESALRRQWMPLDAAWRAVQIGHPPTSGHSFFASLLESGFGLIAERKGRSPSRGFIADPIALNHAVGCYENHHLVRAISVLTQYSHFGGDLNDVAFVRKHSKKPILRKDFIFDDYEVIMSRALGADAILLMASVVTDPAQFQDLHDLAISLGMDVLCEVRDEDEIARLPVGVRICGINSRDFLALGEQREAIDSNVFRLVQALPQGCVKVAESGITPATVPQIAAMGFHAALVGTALLTHGSPKAALDAFETGLMATTLG